MRVIYCIIHNDSGMCYIGQTSDFENRVKVHKKSKSGALIHKAIRQYGSDAFTFKKLVTCQDDEANDKEQEAILAFNSVEPNGYNSESGGNKGKTISNRVRRSLSNSARKRVCSNETKSKMSATRKGRKGSTYGSKLSDITKVKISISLLGNKYRLGIRHTPETIAKITKSSTGKSHSEATKAKMSEARKRYWEEKNGKKTQVEGVERDQQRSPQRDPRSHKGASRES